MSKPFPLKTLLDLAQERSDAAAAQLGLVNVHARDMQNRLQLLLDYRLEYSNRLVSDAKLGIGSVGWLNFRQFIDTIDAAIEKQREMVAAAKQQVEAAKLHWHAEQGRLRSFETLEQRHHREQRVVEARLEQKELDNFVLKDFLGGGRAGGIATTPM